MQQERSNPFVLMEPAPVPVDIDDGCLHDEVTIVQEGISGHLRRQLGGRSQAR